MPKPRAEYGVTAEEFVKVWSSSNSIGEVAQRLHMPEEIASSRASGYRSAGVKLKHMPRADRRKLDVAELNRIVDSLEG